MWPEENYFSEEQIFIMYTFELIADTNLSDLAAGDPYSSNL
jgi:hypothetical protein